MLLAFDRQTRNFYDRLLKAFLHLSTRASVYSRGVATSPAGNVEEQARKVRTWKGYGTAVIQRLRCPIPQLWQLKE